MSEPRFEIVWLPLAQQWAVVHVDENVEMDRFGSLLEAEAYVVAYEEAAP